MHLRPSNSLRRFNSAASAGTSTPGLSPAAPSAPAGPIRKKKPQTWLRNSLLRESEKQANRRGRPQKYLQNVPPEVFQRRGPDSAAAAAPSTPAAAPAQDAATHQHSTEDIPALQNVAQFVQQQLAGTQIPQQLVSSWPFSVMAASYVAASESASASAPLHCAAQQQQSEQQQQCTLGLQKQLIAAPVLPCVSGNSSDSTASAYVSVQQQQQMQWPGQQLQKQILQASSLAAIQSCGESSNSSRQRAVPPQQCEQQVSLVAALCGIYSSNSNAPSGPKQLNNSAIIAPTLPIPVPARCSSTSCSPVVAASAVANNPVLAADRCRITSDYEQFKCDVDGAPAADALEGLGDIDQLVEEVTGWNGDMLSCLLEPGTSCLDQCVSDSWDALAGPIVRNALSSPEVDGLASWDGCMSDMELSDGGWGPAMFLE